jgi:hypothetical protein
VHPHDRATTTKHKSHSKPVLEFGDINRDEDPNEGGFKQNAFKSMVKAIQRKSTTVLPSLKKSKTTLSKLRKKREKETTKSVVFKSIRKAPIEKSVTEGATPSFHTRKVKILKNMGDLILQDTKLEEQERRYNQDEGFHEFLRKQATIRNIASIFTQMRENRLKRLKNAKDKNA